MPYAYRNATAVDADALLQMLQEDHHDPDRDEKLAASQDLTLAEFRCAIASNWCRVLIAVLNDMDGDEKEIVGCVLYNISYSTWQGRFLCVQHIYVRSAHRGKGIASQLWVALARFCQTTDFKRFQWNLPENVSDAGQRFFAKFPKVNLREAEGWLEYRLAMPDIERLANTPPVGKDTTWYDIRKMTQDDSAAVLGLVEELASFENMESGPELEPQTFGRDISAGYYDCFVVSLRNSVSTGDNTELPARTIVAYALYYHAYSLGCGRYIFLEDLYVKPACRSRGVGTALWRALAEICVHQNIREIHWNVLDWNIRAIEFYQKLGGQHLAHVHLFRMRPQDIEQVAKQ